MRTANFFTFARVETQNWDADALPAGCSDVIGLYLVRENEATYCCSLTPSSWAEFLRNVFIFSDPDAGEDFNNSNDGYLEYENGGVRGTYFDLIDPTKVDARFISTPTAVDDEDDEDDEDAQSLWEAAREAYNAGALDEPSICEYESLKTYRRGLNLPVSGLPLFANGR